MVREVSCSSLVSRSVPPPPAPSARLQLAAEAARTRQPLQQAQARQQGREPGRHGAADKAWHGAARPSQVVAAVCAVPEGVLLPDVVKQDVEVLVAVPRRPCQVCIKIS